MVSLSEISGPEIPIPLNKGKSHLFYDNIEDINIDSLLRRVRGYSEGKLVTPGCEDEIYDVLAELQKNLGKEYEFTLPAYNANAYLLGFKKKD